jgi:Transglycosylase SLT domain
MRFSRLAPEYLALCAAALVLAAGTFPGHGATDPAALCQDAAAGAAERTGVPYEVLLAITLVETGHARDGQTRPWPWTLNQGGEGRWLASKAEAETAARTVLDAGTTNLDLGCFQLNHRWHAENFASLGDMLDPGQNALYAARFLGRLYDETGSWPDAAAAYHSRTPEYADRYRDKFKQVLASLGATPPPPAEAVPEVARANRFPLLVAGRRGTFGSLVPATQTDGPLIGGP